MWGYGPTNYGPSRLAITLAAKDLNKRLDDALAPLRTLEPPGIPDLAEAHRRFFSYHECRLPSLGPAFFTKVMYCAGYRRGATSVQPLILDQRVVAQLQPEEWPSLQRRRGTRAGGLRPASEWSTGPWLTYCNWAWNQATGRKIEPDEVEMRLFAGIPTAQW